MRTWLFYKTKLIDGAYEVDIRRVDYQGISESFPAALKRAAVCANELNLERAIEMMVRAAGWVGEPPRSADHLQLPVLDLFSDMLRKRIEIIQIMHGGKFHSREFMCAQQV